MGSRFVLQKVMFGGDVWVRLSLRCMTVFFFNNFSGQVLNDLVLQLHLYRPPGSLASSCRPVCWIGIRKCVRSDQRTFYQDGFLVMNRGCAVSFSGACFVCVGGGADVWSGMRTERHGTHTFSIELSFDSLLHVSQVVCVQPGCRVATKITETRGL